MDEQLVLHITHLTRLDDGWLIRFSGPKDNFMTMVACLKLEGLDKAHWTPDAFDGRGAWFLDFTTFHDYTDAFENIASMRAEAETKYQEAQQKRQQERAIPVKLILQFTKDQAFGILGLAPDAPSSDIQVAYRNLAKRIHPDQGGTHMLMVILNTAYDACMQARKREGA